jgi:Zn-dependent protease
MTSLSILQVMALVGIQINLMLALFNLLPIPPLDGSHVVKHALPPRGRSSTSGSAASGCSS